jgi:hypothetical protein
VKGADVQRTINDETIHFVEHGAGIPLVALHGSGVDHREIEAAVEAVVRSTGYRRIYPDLPALVPRNALRAVASLTFMSSGFSLKFVSFLRSGRKVREAACGSDVRLPFRHEMSVRLLGSSAPTHVWYRRRR